MMKSMLQATAAALVVAAMLVPPALSQSQSPPTMPPPAPAASPQAAAAPASKGFTQEQLDQMLASIALYPDALLSQVLMASTYPLEIVEADRWAKANTSLKGTALEDALKGQKWDESVKSLTAFPEVLDRMNKDLSWTQQLGDAFLGQQQQVMETVQNLRKKAQAAGNLKTTEQQKVVVENNYITVEPANPQVIYVPTYNPTIVYGPWWYPTYPPYYPPYWVHPGAAFVNGFFWGAGIAAGAALWGGFNWNNHDVNINVNRYNNFNKTNISNSNWNHNAAHRNGVPYRDNGARQKYGADQQRAAQSREQFRGRDSAQGAQGLNNRSGMAQEANRPGANTRDTGNAGANRGGSAGAGASNFGGSAGAGSSNFGGNHASDRGGSFNVGNGAQTRDYSNRGASSMGNRSSAGGGARAGGGGGGARGGGGGGRGGGRR